MRELNAEKIRDMTEDEIETRIRELHEEIFNLRFRNAMRQLQNPVLIRERRRDIARMRTILVEHRSGVRALAGHSTVHGHEASGAPKAAPAKAAPAKAAAPAKKTPVAAKASAAKAPKAKPAARGRAASKAKKAAKESTK
jgi:large subunit ribosomal protein L29